LRCAYADPPYLGCGKFYVEHHPNALDWDKLETHQKLIEQLTRKYPDGWAYSLSSVSLKKILPLCPDDVRVGAWVKPFCSFKPNVNPAYAWEPVIFFGGRRRTRKQLTLRDWVSANITLKKGLTGAKPEPFCKWLFEMLNLQANDKLVDLYPGTRAVGVAWKKYRKSIRNDNPTD